MRKTILLMITFLFLGSIISPTSSAAVSWEVKIAYNGEWSGSVGGDGSSSSYEGYGGRTISVSGDVASAAIQKGEDNSAELCVSISTGGEVKDSSCTTAGYGVVSVSASEYSDVDSIPGFSAMGAISILGMAAITFSRERQLQ